MKVKKAFAVKVKRNSRSSNLAIKLENDMDKDKILENYMNTINLDRTPLVSRPHPNGISEKMSMN